MATPPLLYFARMNVQPAFLDRFEDWYRRKHAPDLLASGFLSCAAYHAVGGAPLVHNVYEIDDIELFSSTSYQDARTEERDPERPQVLSWVSNRSNTPYEQRMTAGEAVDLYQPWLTTAQFTAEGLLDGELDEWFETAIPELLAAGAQSLRLCRRHGTHPANPSPDVPAWMLLATWRDRESASAGPVLPFPSDAAPIFQHLLRRVFVTRANSVRS